MLTRLKVNGFKNLIDVDASFGPFTCIAGANGVGKSNLFDAITFLSALADIPLLDAARCVRDERNRSTSISSLFFHSGESTLDEMAFEAEMLVPPEGDDELGQRARAAITFLRYRLVLGYEHNDDGPVRERLVVRHEELTHINKGEAPKVLSFDHSKAWRDSVVRGVRRGGPFVSTADKEDGTRVVQLHQDGGAGRPRELLASNLPRTVLSSTNSVESPTALLAKREMQSWRLLHLEPSALREPDSFSNPTHIGPEGAYLASTLYHLIHTNGNGASSAQNGAQVCTLVANRLAELVEDVRDINVDVDHQRELLTLQVRDRNGAVHAARALSDGTLRFLALAILELDPESRGLLCFEEPENGIHPERIPAMLHLLKDLSVDTSEEVGPDNPLRQVIVNTHSPAVVGLVDDADLLVAESTEVILDGNRNQAVRFSWLDETWRSKIRPEQRTLARGKLQAYLNPLSVDDDIDANSLFERGREPRRRVKDRQDLQLLLPYGQ